MKKISIFAIEFYQRILSVFLLNLGLKTDCRYFPTCSEYAKKSISDKGFVKGSYLSFVRILKCQPFYNEKNEGGHI